MDGEYRKGGKREGPKIAARAKIRIKEYIADGIAPGWERYQAKLSQELRGTETNTNANLFTPES